MVRSSICSVVCSSALAGSVLLVITICTDLSLAATTPSQSKLAGPEPVTDLPYIPGCTSTRLCWLGSRS
jgi:hypothetical protein